MLHKHLNFVVLDIKSIKHTLLKDVIGMLACRTCHCCRAKLVTVLTRFARAAVAMKWCCWAVQWLSSLMGHLVNSDSNIKPARQLFSLLCFSNSATVCQKTHRILWLCPCMQANKLCSCRHVSSLTHNRTSPALSLC